MRLKVAQYITSTVDGGSARVACSYAIGLDKNKFDVVFVVKYNDPESAIERLLKEHEIRVCSIFNKPVPTSNSLIRKATRKLIEAAYVPYKIKKIIKEEQVDIIHIHAGITYFKWIASSLKNVKFFFTCHTSPEHYFVNGNDNYRVCKKLIYKNDLRLIALHQEMKIQLDQMFGINNTVVIRNGIDFFHFIGVKESKESIKKRLGIPEEAFVIGNVARFSPEKNHEFLIKIFDNIKKKNNNAFLLLVGAGPLKEGIIKKLESLGLMDNTVILSNRNDIPELLKAMDTFVFPSLFEGLGIVLIEAQVAGIRCVVSERIPSEVLQTKLVVQLRLDDSIDTWSNVILDSSILGKAEKNIDDYNIKSVIEELERIYILNWRS